jgi:hypothetical protein
MKDVVIIKIECSVCNTTFYRSEHMTEKMILELYETHTQVSHTG